MTRNPLPTPQPDRRGSLRSNPEGTAVQCHACGLWRESLATHVVYVHGMSAEEYRERYGLPAELSLAAPKSGRAATPGKLRTALLLGEGTAEPGTGADGHPGVGSRLDDTVKLQRNAMERRARTSLSRGRALVEAERQSLATCSSLEEWVATAKALIRAGASYSTIAQAVGISTSEVSWRFRIYKPKSAGPHWGNLA